MKKTYKMQNLDCAVCAGKMRDAILKIDGVNSADVSFLTQKLTIDADEEKLDAIMKQVVKVCRKVEPDCTILL